MDLYFWNIAELQTAHNEWFEVDCWDSIDYSIAEECMAVLTAEIQLRNCWAE
jgi:hypothetical protein